MYTEICRATTKTKTKNLCKEIYLKKKQKTNDQMSDLSSNISSVNVI